MKEKGIEQYIKAAHYFKKNNSRHEFHIVGFCEEEYEERLGELDEKGIIHFHGLQSNVKEFYDKAHCIIHPSYYPEGMSNVLLESAACGRPAITTNRSGCKEIVEHGKTGYLMEVQSHEDLIESINNFKI